MTVVANITVTVDTSAGTYEFTTDPYVKPPDEPLPVALGESLTIKAGGSQSNVTITAVMPSTATVSAPFDPALQPATTTSAEYALSALGKVTLSVPTYGGRPLTGEPLTVAAQIGLELSASGPSSPNVSFGALVTLTVQGATQTTTVYVPDGLFVGQGTSVQVDPGGTTYTIDDVEQGAYPLSTEQQNTKMIPLIGTINVASTKKPKL